MANWEEKRWELDRMGLKPTSLGNCETFIPLGLNELIYKMGTIITDSELSIL